MFVEFYDGVLTSFLGAIKEGDKMKAVIKKINDDPSFILLSRIPLLKEEKIC